MKQQLETLGRQGKEASILLATLLSSQKDNALLEIASMLKSHIPEIIAANQLDLKQAQEDQMTPAMQDRLLLNEERILQMAQAVQDIVALPDPIGVILEGKTRPNGLEIVKKTVPLGVIGLIYESRPNVTVDCAVLCLKAGNACILKGGKEAIHSNIALANLIQQALEKTGLPIHAVQLVEDTSREATTALMQLNGYVDALIPRGGQGLIQSVVRNATVPVIETGAGNCHLYVDQYANLEMAMKVLDNSKTSRPSVCNATETLLVHKKIAKDFLPTVAKTFSNRVQLRGCENSLPYLGKDALPATEEDWETEYNDYILAIRVVDSLEQALSHIQEYSTQHSEVIVTESYEAAQEFANRVDAAAVYLNASSRFTDGGEFGLGAEIGIATQKLHVRGPMGLTALTSYKYIIRGNGQVR